VHAPFEDTIPTTKAHYGNGQVFFFFDFQKPHKNLIKIVIKKKKKRLCSERLNKAGKNEQGINDTNRLGTKLEQKNLKETGTPKTVLSVLRQ